MVEVIFDLQERSSLPHFSDDLDEIEKYTVQQ